MIKIGYSIVWSILVILTSPDYFQKRITSLLAFENSFYREKIHEIELFREIFHFSAN